MHRGEARHPRQRQDHRSGGDPAASSAALICSRSSRSTCYWRSGRVLATSRRWHRRGHRLDPPDFRLFQDDPAPLGLLPDRRAASLIISRTWDMSSLYGTGKSITARAQPWDSFPT